MSFKNAGFPKFGLNPMGFKKRIGFSIINAVKNLIWADKQVDDYLEDQKGATTYEAVRPAKIVGDGSTYFTFDEINLGTSHTIEFSYASSGSTGIIVGSETNTLYFVADINGVDIRYSSLVTIDFGGAITDTLFHDYKIVRNAVDVSLYIDDILHSTQTLGGNNELLVSELLSRLGGTSTLLTGSLQTINLNNQATYNAQTLINRDGTFKDYLEDISGNGNHAQQWVAGPIPALYDDSLELSIYNRDGYSVAKALGNQLADKNIFESGIVDADGDSQVSSTNTRTGYIYCKDLQNVTISGSTGNTQGTFRIAFYDKNKETIEVQEYSDIIGNGIYTVPSGTIYLRTFMRNESVDTFMLNDGETALTYEAWEGIYLDEALTTPYKDGDFISALNTTKCIGWISDGSGGAERASLDFKGRIKFDVDIVDGVVDLATEDVEDSSTSSLVNGNSITVTVLGGTYNSSRISMDTTNTIKTIVVKSKIINGTDSPRIEVKASDLTELLNFEMPLADTEYRKTFTPIDLFYEIRFNGTWNTEELAIKEYYDFAIYEGDYVTGTPPLPTTGKFVTGNTWKLDPAYNKAVIADVNEHAYDKTDPTEVASKLLPCEDAVYSGDYLFTSLKDDGIVAMYEVAQTEPNYTKILKELGLNEPLYDSEGNLLYDSEGSQLYALTDKVERVM